MTELSLGRSRTAARDAVRRIKAWAEERFGSSDDVWVVTEVECGEPGRAPRQTVLALLHPAASVSFRIAKPLCDIQQEDVVRLGDAAAALAAEGCC